MPFYLAFPVIAPKIETLYPRHFPLRPLLLYTPHNGTGPRNWHLNAFFIPHIGGSFSLPYILRENVVALSEYVFTV